MEINGSRVDWIGREVIRRDIIFDLLHDEQLSKHPGKWNWSYASYSHRMDGITNQGIQTWVSRYISGDINKLFGLSLTEFLNLPYHLGRHLMEKSYNITKFKERRMAELKEKERKGEAIDNPYDDLM